MIICNGLVLRATGECLRITTKRDAASSDIVMIIHPENGPEQIERFRSEAAFTLRIQALEAELRDGEWNLGRASLLEDVWKLN